MTNQAVNRPQQLIALVRANEWWSFKLAPVLGTAYASAVISNIPLISLWPTLLFLLMALVIGASYASIINNLCDREEDQISGKANYLVGQSNLFIALILIVCIALGLIVSGILIQAPLALSIYIGNWLLFTVYSLPPIRLKKRGFWGVLSIAVGESFVPQMLAVFLVTHHTGKPLPTIWLTMIAIWALALGLRSILWHQIVDFKNDQRAGINTFAVDTSTENLRKIGKWVVFPIELVSLLGILLLSRNAVMCFFLGLYSVTEWLRNYFWQLKIVIVAPANNHRIFLFEYYDVFYPLGFLCIASWKDQADLLLLGIHLLLYYQRLWWWIRDGWGLLRWEIPNKLQSYMQ